MDFFGISPSGGQQTAAEYLDESAFDEKFEVDLERDEIRNLYHVENKYYVPVMSGSFREMFRYGRQFMVHPDDHTFHELMDPQTLAQRLQDAQSAGTLRAECRQKLVDGSYRWVQYLAISGSGNGVPEGKIWFYVFDIQNQKDRQSGVLPKARFLRDRNALTGLLGSESFVPGAAELYARGQGSWCCLAIDIQNYKIFTTWFGQEKGSYILARIGALLLALERNGEAAVAYFGQDTFGVFLRHDREKIRQLYDRIKEIILSYSNTVGFLPAFGIHMLAESEQPGLDMYDKARMAVENAKRGSRERICYFDSEEYDRTKREYALLTDFQSALQNKEIGFYLQPQCRISTGQIVGAEALVRWIKPDGTVLAPGAFVPLLEKNGFITELDKAVWEAVCRWLRELLDKAAAPLPVSVNVSQVDLLSMDVAAYLYGLTERYNVPARLLKVEITESAYAENFERMSLAVERLKSMGFAVLMDDFGAGYSSLNMLDKINTDVLKLDMAFMRKNSGLSKRGISIVESIISMTKTLNIPVIIEGVETETQIDFLRSLGCRYAQGYYFYRPMPREEYEALIRDPEKVDDSGFRNRVTELFHAREFLNEALFTDTVLNNILGPVAFYSLDREGRLDIVRFNQQFYECIADVQMEERKTAIHNYIVPQDHPAFFRMLEKAGADPIHGGECTVRFFKSGGGVFWYHMHLYLLRENEQGKLFYGKIANATGMYQQGKAFFELLKDNSDGCMRIDLKQGMIYELLRDRPFDDPEARKMKVEDCLLLTAERHIEIPEDRKRFVDFFRPERLRRSLDAGIYSETFRTKFLSGGEWGTTSFSAYYIKFMPDQDDNVYVFSNREL